MSSYGSIGSSTCLPVGAVVKVGDMRGTVLSDRLAANGVVVHKVRFTHTFRRVLGAVRAWEPMPKPKTKEVNYSFIEVQS